MHAACTLPKDASALEALIAFAATEPGDDLKPLFDLPSTVLKATPLHCAAKWATAPSEVYSVSMPTAKTPRGHAPSGLREQPGRVRQIVART